MQPAYFCRTVFLFLTFFILTLELTAQSDTTGTSKGVTVTSQTPANNRIGETYAIIMGISKYQSQKIPQLQFADKDAELFHDFLLSPAGGNAKKENILELINENAKQADFILNAQRWLRKKGLNKEEHKGDRLFIYLSGHGVEPDDDIYYFLPYDCAPENDEANYTNLGTAKINITELKADYIKPYTTTGVNVFLIMDACRSDINKIPGGNTGQLKITNSIAEKKAGDIMLYSASHGQVSFEDPRIGGGHGLFTYWLVDGLYGGADKKPNGNEDGKVSLREIRKYVNDMVPIQSDSLFKKSQDPFTCCDDDFNKIIANVDAQTYSSWIYKKTIKNSGEKQDVASNEPKIPVGKGIGDLSNSDSTQIKSSFGDSTKNGLYSRFLEATKNISLVRDSTAESLYTEIERRWPADSVTEDARYVLAITYLNFCQEKINLFLSGKGIEHIIDLEKEAVKENAAASNNSTGMNTEKIDKIKTVVNTDYIKAEAMMTKAFDLLKNEPGILMSYQPKFNFIKTMAAYAGKKNDLKHVLRLCRNTIAGDTLSPTGYLLMGWILKDMENDSCKNYFWKATAIAPKWPYPVNGLGNYYLSESKYDSALKYFNKAIELDSLNSEAFRNRGMIHLIKGGYNGKKDMVSLIDSELVAARTDFIQARNLNPSDCYTYLYFGNHQSMYHFPSNETNTKDNYSKAIKCDSNFALGYKKMADFYLNRYGDTMTALIYLQKCLTKNPANAEGYRNLGNFYFTAKADTANAILNLKRAISLDPATSMNYFALARLYKKLQNKPKAREIYKDALDKIGNNKALYNEIGNTFFDASDIKYAQTDSALKYYKMAYAIDSSADYINYNIGQVYLIKNFNNEDDSSVYYFAKAIINNSLRWSKKIPVVAEYYYNKKDYRHAIPFYQKNLSNSPFEMLAIVRRLVECLIAVKEFSEAENAVNKYISPENQKSNYDSLMTLINEAKEKKYP